MQSGIFEYWTEINNVQVVELVDTLSWGGSDVSREGSSPSLDTIIKSGNIQKNTTEPQP